MLRILTKCAFTFTRPSEKAGAPNAPPDSFVWVKPGIPTDVPDWVKDDQMFKWGKKDGDIMMLVVEPQVQVKEEVKEFDDSPTPKRPRANAPTS